LRFLQRSIVHRSRLVG